MEYGLIGEKLGHSFSPLIHSLIGNYKYELKEIAPEKVADFFKNRNFSAVNITIPYKQTVMPMLDFIDNSAKIIGAVNTVVNKNGKLYGYNTDYYGLRSLILKNCTEFSGKTALILGTGGTSNTAYAVLKDLGVNEIIKVSRNPNEKEIDYKTAVSFKNYAGIIINTTPMGMYPNIDGMPLDISKFNNLKLVIDVIYNPFKTNLVIEAENRNIPSEGGLYMLVAQAVAASEYFFDTKYDITLCDKIYNNILNRIRNIVLIGMPASGKSTIGKLLAKILNKEFIDTDDLIVKNTGKQITEIFSSVGEEGFRKIESEVISSVAIKNNCVIATGGGAVLNSENIKNLRHNGIICFIDRPLDELVPTSDRPTASSKESIIKRYNERINIYKKSCDFSVGVIGPQNTAKLIIKEVYNDSFDS